MSEVGARQPRFFCREEADRMTSLVGDEHFKRMRLMGKGILFLRRSRVSN